MEMTTRQTDQDLQLVDPATGFLPADSTARQDTLETRPPPAFSELEVFASLELLEILVLTAAGLQTSLGHPWVPGVTS